MRAMNACWGSRGIASKVVTISHINTHVWEICPVYVNWLKLAQDCNQGRALLLELLILLTLLPEH